MPLNRSLGFPHSWSGRYLEQKQILASVGIQTPRLSSMYASHYTDYLILDPQLPDTHQTNIFFPRNYLRRGSPC